MTSIRSALGSEQGYLIRVARFEALGIGVDDFLVHAHDLADEDEVDGLLGLDFLRRFRLTFDFSAGQLIASPVTA